MSKRKPELLIEDIIESGNKILTYSRSIFLKNPFSTKLLLPRIPEE